LPDDDDDEDDDDVPSPSSPPAVSGSSVASWKSKIVAQPTIGKKTMLERSRSRVERVIGRELKEKWVTYLK